MPLKQKIMRMIYGRLLLLLVILILLLILMYFDTSDSFSQSSVSNEIYERRTRKPKIPRNNTAPIIFSKLQYLNQTRKPNENVICFLVPGISGEIRLGNNAYPKLRQRVLELDERLDDNFTTDVIIFHTGYPFREDLLPIIKSSRRQIEFVNIDHIFYKFSPGFEPHATDPTWSMIGKWNYHHMCYFWFKQVFGLKIMQRYRYMMRLDYNSQIQGKWPNIFEIMAKQEVLYIANHKTRDFEHALPGITLVRNVTAAHIIKNNITALNPDMLTEIFNHTIEVPNYRTNIEVIDLSLMRRKEVLDFVKAIDESKGIFLYQWSDAPLRYITLALFANASQVLHRETLGLGYFHVKVLPKKRQF